MSRRVVLFGISIAFILLLTPTVLDSPLSVSQSASAQEPSLQDSLSVTAVVRDGEAFAQIPERGRHDFWIDLEDHRIQGVGLTGGSVQVKCRASQNTTASQFWGFTQPGIRTLTNNGDTAATRLSIFTQSRPTPEIFVLDVECIGLGAMQGKVITEFQVGAQVVPYTYMRLVTHSDFPPPTVRPDHEFTHKIVLQNRGNRDAYFQGEVIAPEGWTVAYPESVFVNAGEDKEITITGLAPSDKLYYRYDSALFEANYWPEGQEDRGQSRSIPASVNGFYLHPALIPLILLGIAAVVMLFFLVVFARRTVEEQVLGKPIPPWRIPVEREHLNKLEQEDPDEFYLLRYHLMVEEHHSALLWYRHFKHATRKDRKIERKWLKKSDKVKAKNERLENRQERFKRFTARRLRVLPARRRRRLAALDKRVLASQWREQKGLLKTHKKSVKRIDKLHSKQNERSKKKQMAAFEKEYKRIGKENKKRIKQGEEPEPLPEEPSLEFPEPEFPQPVEVPLVAVDESRYAVKHERMNRRYKRKIAKRTQSAQRRMDKKDTKRKKRAERMRRKLPAAPSVHMYDEDDFVDEGDALVDDTKPRLHRVLNLPTLEEREHLRRRRRVYRARMNEAANQKDEARLEQLKREWQQERARITGKNRKEPSEAAPRRGMKGSSSTKDTDSVSAGPGGRSLLGLRRKKATQEEGSDRATDKNEDDESPNE